MNATVGRGLRRLNSILPFAVLAIVIMFLTELTPTNDAAWQMWVGRQILSGARLYRDIIEINPPLWFWIGVPISPFGWQGLLVFFGLSAALSITLVRRLYPYQWLPYALIFAFFLTGISATAQREQFSLIAVTPYILLSAARAEDREVSLRLALVVGLWAALGFALKHYFGLLPLVLQAWLLLRRRSITPEFVVVCLSGAAYVAAIFILTPAYLTEIVPLVREAYGFYDQRLVWFLTSEVVLLGALTTVGFCIASRKDALIQALAISAAVFLFIYVAQLKGFRYQGLPTLGLLSLIAFSLLDLSTFRNRVASAILIFVPIYTLMGSAALPPKSRTAAYLCTLPRGSRVLALAVNGGNMWPAVEICNLEWSSRQMILWTLVSPKLNRFTRNEILHDLATGPDFVVIDKTPIRASPYQFVKSDRRILSALQQYRVTDENERFVALKSKPVVHSQPK